MTRLPALLLLAGAVVALAVAAEPPAAPAPRLHPGAATPAVAAGLRVVEAEIQRLEARSKTLRGLLEGESERRQALRGQLDTPAQLAGAALDTPARWSEARANWSPQALHAVLAAYDKQGFKADPGDPELTTVQAELRSRAALAHKAVESCDRQLRDDPDRRRQKFVPALQNLDNALGRALQTAAQWQTALQGRIQELDTRLIILRQQVSTLRPAPTPERLAVPGRGG
ncbi:MAG: hypothetical protein Q8Q28_04190 [Pseudomonadota bacterium]|nr:hypothetical protein [Pseudomonadota bacterium]